MADERLEPIFQIELPPKMLPGVFADFANIWHTPNVFVMDFVALAQPPQPVEDENNQTKMIVPGQIVGRIRIPPQQVFEMAKALTQQLEAWEQETGGKPPQSPLFAPPPQSDS